MDLPIAIVGATGHVGQEVIRQLLSYGASSLHLAASPSSEGCVLSIDSHTFSLLSIENLPPCAFYILATPEEVSRFYAPLLLKKGAYVLDTSSAFRMDPSVPLISSLINGHLITPSTHLYAHSNCIASPLSLILYPLVSYGITEGYISTYQSVSGAGWLATEEFKKATRDFLDSVPLSPCQHLPLSLAFNLFPEVGSYTGAGSTGEEEKIKKEVQKILSHSFSLHVTSVRVPTLQGHAMAIWLSFAQPFCLQELISLWKNSPGLEVIDSHYPTPLSVVGTDKVVLGRIYQDSPTHLHVWAASDNLRRGAATDLVESALRLGKMLEKDS